MILTSTRAESLNTESLKYRRNMHVRVQTWTLLNGSWRSQNIEHFCSHSGRIIGGRRSCNDQQIQLYVLVPWLVPLPWLSHAVRRQREDMLLISECEKGSTNIAPAFSLWMPSTSSCPRAVHSQCNVLQHLYFHSLLTSYLVIYSR